MKNPSLHPKIIQATRPSEKDEVAALHQLRNGKVMSSSGILPEILKVTYHT